MKAKPRYCPQCGSDLNQVPFEGRIRPICSVCGFIVYENPVPSVAAVLMRNGRILLVKRNIEPGFGLWCLPGGFIEAGETIEEAAIREVQEETDIHCDEVRVVDAKSVLGGYYGDVVVLCCTAKINGSIPSAGGDADAADFFELKSLPPIAFSVHRQLIMKYGRQDA
jgi:8-oxo-dGTP diphosphatase